MVVGRSLAAGPEEISERLHTLVVLQEAVEARERRDGDKERARVHRHCMDSCAMEARPLHFQLTR